MLQVTDMTNRRNFLGAAAASLSLAANRKPRVACLMNVWFPNSHADVFVPRLLDGYRLDHAWNAPRLDTVALYVDQFPHNDMAREVAEEHRIPIYRTIGEALRLGGKALAVDAVAVVGEHGDYPRTPRGNYMYPRRRYFDEIADAMKQAGRVVPVFHDKYFAYDWADAKSIYDRVREMRIPFLCGSTVPLAWRRPALDLPRATPITEILATSYSDLEEHAYHAIESLQAVAERRPGGETGVERVRHARGEEVWDLARRGEWSRDLLDAALSRRVNHVPNGSQEPEALLIRYRDGLKASILHVNAMTRDYIVATRINGRAEIAASCFYIQLHVHNHWSFMVRAFENLALTQRNPNPIERTLTANGIMLAGLESRRRRGAWVETPEISVSYLS